MYQVIARTWRPQRFSEVIGQKHVTQTLQNAIRLNRIGHGYIFSGQRGTGKTTVARLLAKALNCHRGPAAEPCGECDSCREIAAGRSLDVIEIDAASNRGIDAVRELRENARYAPARDRFKIFIIDEAHQITTEGFNALLKTLEEPPSHVVFLLATTEVHQFPETILSRCQHFSLHTLTFSEIVDHLKKVCEGENVDADSESLAVLAKSGQGSLRDALSRLEQAIAAFGNRLEGAAVRRFLGEPPSSLIEEIFQAIREKNREQVLRVVERLVDGGYQLSHFCSQLLRAVRNLLVIRVAGPEPRLLEASPEEIQALSVLAASFSEESLTRFLEILLRVYQELRTTMEPRFQLELGLLKLVDAERLVAIEDLVAQLSAAPGVDRSPGNLPRSGAATPAGVRDFHNQEVSGGIRDARGREASAAPIPAAPKLTPWEQDQLRKREGQDSAGDSSISLSNAPEERNLRPLSNPQAVSAAAKPSDVEAGSGALASGRVAVVEEPGEESDERTIAEPLPKNEASSAIYVSQILGNLEEQSRPGLAALLAEATSWEFGESEVVIALPSAAVLNVVSMDRQRLEAVCSSVLRRKLAVKLVERAPSHAQPNRSAAALPGMRANRNLPSEARVRQDPDVAEFERVFGKTITVTRNWKE